jgi:hypothetical protein
MSIFRKTTEILFGKKTQVVNIKPTIPLQAYLDKYYKETLALGRLGAQPPDDSTPNLQVPISLFAHANTGGLHEYAGVHHDDMHFSASLLKVAPMFAAFSLREEARKLAAPGGFANANAFFNALKGKFSSADAVLPIRTAGVGLEPRYTDILSVTGFGGGTLAVNFIPAFYRSLLEDRALYNDYLDVRAAHNLGVDANGRPIENAASLAALARVSHLYKMIVPSNNASAGECIRRLGYAYINVKLMNAGLFNRDSSKGIWVAGDYVGGTRVEVPSVNDGDVALATTSRQMATFFSLIQLKKLIDESNSEEMQDLLQEAQRIDPSWLSMNISRTAEAVRKFKVERVKIGFANLKPNTPRTGPNVYSEGFIARWTGDAADLAKRNLNGELAVCWQNVRVGSIASGFDGIAEVIEKAFENFIKQTSI